MPQFDKLTDKDLASHMCCEKQDAFYRISQRGKASGCQYFSGQLRRATPYPLSAFLAAVGAEGFFLGVTVSDLIIGRR
jgi:hypothetical protein